MIESVSRMLRLRTPYTTQSGPFLVEQLHLEVAMTILILFLLRRSGVS